MNIPFVFLFSGNPIIQIWGSSNYVDSLQNISRILNKGIIQSFSPAPNNFLPFSLKRKLARGKIFTLAAWALNEETDEVQKGHISIFLISFSPIVDHRLNGMTIKPEIKN